MNIYGKRPGEPCIADRRCGRSARSLISVQDFTLLASTVHGDRQERWYKSFVRIILDHKIFSSRVFWPEDILPPLSVTYLPYSSVVEALLCNVKTNVSRGIAGRCLPT